MCTRLSLQGLSISSSARAIQALEIMYAPSVLAGGRHCPRPFSCGQRSRRDTCTAALHASDRSEGAAAYRRAVLGGIALVFGLPVQQASAGSGEGFGWDGSSSASGSCSIGDEGGDCRKQLLLKDKIGGTAYPSKQDGRPQASTQGIPIAEMKDAYTKDTVALSEVVDKYFSLDSFDPQRPAVVKTLKTEGAAWASKYARGGSARKLSARKFYIVVDALQGHLTSNGFAPLAASKTKTLQKSLEETRDLLAKGA